MNFELIIATFESVAVLLGLGLLGFWVISKKILPSNALSFLSPLALDIALPSLVFANIIMNFRPAEFSGWWMLPLWWGGFTILTGIMTGLFTYISRKSIRCEFAISLFFQNGLFFPLAIITGMFGATSKYLVDLFFFMLFYPSLFFSTYHLFFREHLQKLDWTKILNRVLIATLLATVLRLIGIHGYVPGFVVSGLKMIGDMTLPILMIILGGNIYVDFKNKGELFVVEIIKFLFIKNIIFPLVTLLLLLLIRPPYHVALMMILQSSVPPLTAVPIVVERAGRNRSIVNQFMFTSFVFSLITIPVMMYLFGLYFPSP